MPCGITVVDGEVYCSDQASGWSLFGIDANKIPYSGGGDFYVKLTAPDYSTAELSAMNLERETNGLVLYSSRKGANTGTDGNGSEVVLIPDGEGNFLTPGATVRMRVQGNPNHAGSMNACCILPPVNPLKRIAQRTSTSSPSLKLLTKDSFVPLPWIYRR